jgi:hypothetical protein
LTEENTEIRVDSNSSEILVNVSLLKAKVGKRIIVQKFCLLKLTDISIGLVIVQLYNLINIVIRNRIKVRPSGCQSHLHFTPSPRNPAFEFSRQWERG